MSPARPPLINAVMVAAADLEDAEFERDRLAMACGDAIRQALGSGVSHEQIAAAANLQVAEVRRLAALPSPGPDVLVSARGERDVEF